MSDPTHTVYYVWCLSNNNRNCYGKTCREKIYDPNPNILVQIKHENLHTFQAQLKSIGITQTELL